MKLLLSLKFGLPLSYARDRIRAGTLRCRGVQLNTPVSGLMVACRRADQTVGQGIGGAIGIRGTGGERQRRAFVDRLIANRGQRGRVFTSFTVTVNVWVSLRLASHCLRLSL